MDSVRPSGDFQASVVLLKTESPQSGVLTNNLIFPLLLKRDIYTLTKQ